jgi:MFS family permease
VGIGVAVWSLASGATGLAETFFLMWLARICVGIGEAAYGPAAPTIISDLYPVERRGAVLAWFYMAIPVGAALGYMFGGFFTHGAIFSAFYGWHGAFYCVVIPGLAMAAFCFLRRDPPRGQADGGATDRRASLRDYLTLFKTPSYVLDTLGMAAMTFAIGGIQFWMPAYLHEQRHAGALDTVNLYFGIILAASGLSATLLGGMAGDFLRPRVRGAYFLVSAAGLLLSVLFVGLMLITPFPLAWVWIFLAVFWLFFNTGPANTILANVVHPSMRSTAFAVNILVIHLLGDVPAPPLLGRLSARLGWNSAFGLVGLAMAVGGLLWLLGMRYLDRDTERAPLNPPGDLGF